MLKAHFKNLPKKAIDLAIRTLNNPLYGDEMEFKLDQIKNDEFVIVGSHQHIMFLIGQIANMGFDSLLNVQPTNESLLSQIYYGWETVNA